MHAFQASLRVTTTPCRPEHARDLHAFQASLRVTTTPCHPEHREGSARVPSKVQTGFGRRHFVSSLAGRFFSERLAVSCSSALATRALEPPPRFSRAPSAP